MSSRKRMVLAVVLVVALLTAGTIGMAAATTLAHGNILVQVRSTAPGGDNIHLAVPATLAEAAIALVPSGMLRDEIPARDIEPFAPAIRELALQIRDLPDAVFVEVESADETVRIEKRDGRFIIDVQDGVQTVHISVPVTTVDRAMSKLRDLV